MRKMLYNSIIVMFLFVQNIFATFSIVAVDSITGEIGSAGATCIDKADIVNYFGFGYASFFADVTANIGSINSQCYYLEKNQQNAHKQLIAGRSSSQIIDWLINNDSENKPWIRQYGVVTLKNGHPEASAYTGDSCFDYMGQRVGKYYAIQGNLLLGKEVLDSMESCFLRENRGLKYKLMAALQGAKMLGADKRCEPYGTSSLLAFLKLTKPNADNSDSLFYIGVTTYNSQHTEPIDSLQALFNIKIKGNTEIKKEEIKHFTIIQNPASKQIQFLSPASSFQPSKLQLFDYTGRQIITKTLPTMQQDESISVNLSNLSAGVYLVRLKIGKEEYSGKVLLVK